jgi:hypothetical protein
MQRVSAKDSNRQKSRHSHSELEWRIVGITAYSQKKECSHSELGREIVNLRITTKGNSTHTLDVVIVSQRQQSEENTYKLNYKRKLLVSARDNSQEKKKTYILDCRERLLASRSLKMIARRQSTYRLRFLASAKDISQETDRALTFWITEKDC